MSHLIVQNLKEVTLSVSVDAIRLRTNALGKASEIAAVENPEQLEKTVEVLSELKGLTKTMEAARTKEKKPVLDIGRNIDTKSAEYSAPIAEEINRLNAMVTSYYRAEEARAARKNKFLAAVEDTRRANEEAAANEASQAAEELHKAAEAAPTVEAALELQAQAQVQEQVALQAEEKASTSTAVAVAEPTRATGMIAKKTWKFEVLDLKALYAARPELVKLEVRTALVNAAIQLDGGKEIPGLKIYEDTSVTVRAKRF